MRVIRNTPEQLILANRPWLIGVMLILFILVFVGSGLAMLLSGEWAGLIFAGAGGGIGFIAFAAFVRRVQVILDRVDGTITLRRRSVFGYSQVEHELAHLREAVLEATTTSKGGTLYRPVLVLDGGMSAGRHPITQAYTNGRGPQRMADAVNAWLDRAQLDSPPQTA